MSPGACSRPDGPGLRACLAVVMFLPHLTDEESETDRPESLAQGYPAGSGGPGLLNNQRALPLRFS